jgi:hypothetical protein
MFAGRRVVVLGKDFAIWQPKVTAGSDENVSPLIVLDHCPIVEAKMIPTYVKIKFIFKFEMAAKTMIEIDFNY